MLPRGDSLAPGQACKGFSPAGAGVLSRRLPRRWTAGRVISVARKSVSVEVPSPAQDRPRLGRVGIIAAVGFVIGIVWPRLAGVHLVPSAPVDDDNAAVASAGPSASAAPAPAPPPAAKLARAAAKKKEEELDQRIHVHGDEVVTSCLDADGRRHKDCDAIKFGEVARPRIRALAECQAAQDEKGTLSIGFDLDFEKKQITDITSGKSTTLSRHAARGLLKCAKKEFEDAPLDGIAHRYSKYSVYFLADLLVSGHKAEKNKGEAEQTAVGDVTEASGSATVSWQVALIRDAPKDGKRIARLLRGTRVVVTGRKGNWYRVKFGAHDTQGWVYKAAIGM